MRGRATAAILSAALATALVSLGANADHCDSNIVIFSGNQVDGSPQQPPWINSGAVTCSELGHDADGRIVNVGATHVSVRYIMDFGTQYPTIRGYLNGLGFDNREITLTRGTSTLGGTVYDSSRIAVPNAAVPDCVTATIVWPFEDEFGEEIVESNSFHSIGADCPDFSA